MKKYLFNLSQENKILGFGFMYSLVLAVFFQTVILPLLPEVHAGQGILKGDWKRGWVHRSTGPLVDVRP